MLNIKYKNIILIGFKNCGKTTIGKALAKRNKINFVDTDVIIQEKYKEIYGNKLPIEEIYQNLGKIKFRNLENEIVIELVSLSNTVIATGGGTILDSNNLILLKSIGLLIFLKISLPTAIDRMYRDGTLNGVFLGKTKNIQNITHNFKTRFNIYKSAADFSIQVDNLSEKMIIDEITMSLG